MKFFLKHFTRESLVRSPHKWFLAFLISPIHYLEKQYSDHYHLRFVHARKLFFFDLGLVALTIVLITITLYWLTYDPTITRSLELQIAPTIETRVTSGENISFKITYHNRSAEKMLAPELSLLLPSGFYLKNISAPNFSTTTHSISLPDLPAGGNGQIEFSGQFLSTIGHHSPIIAVLSYHRTASGRLEQKNTQYLIHVSDSIVRLRESENFPKQLATGIPTNFSVNIEISKKFAADDITPMIQTFLKNNKDFYLTKLELESDGKTISCSDSFICTIPNDAKNVKMKGQIIADKNILAESIQLEFNSRFVIGENYLNQNTLIKNIQLIKPNFSLTTEIVNPPKFISGGEIITLKGRIKNSGSATARRLRLSIPLPKEMIDAQKLLSLNHVEFKNNTLAITEQFDAKFVALAPNEAIPFTITLPLHTNLPNNLEKFSVKLIFTAMIDGLENQNFEISTESAAVALAPKTTLIAEARYFTADGDQIGRGPIPPTVGKETKYWVLVRYTTSYSELREVYFSATLPDGVSFTERSSVSLGEDITYDPTTRKLSWRTSRLPAYSTVGLNFELAYTPKADQVGKYFDLLRQISLTANDTITGESLKKTFSDLNSSLPKDTEAGRRGTAVR